MATHNRLTVVGTRSWVRRFQDAAWDQVLGARHLELLESSPGRFACQFETDRLPLGPLQPLSKEWPGLVFLLEYETEEKRVKGLAKAWAGELQYHELTY